MQSTASVAWKAKGESWVARDPWASMVGENASKPAPTVAAASPRRARSHPKVRSSRGIRLLRVVRTLGP